MAPTSAETLLVEQCNFAYEKWCIKPWFVNTVHEMYNMTIFIDLYQPHQVHCFFSLSTLQKYELQLYNYTNPQLHRNHFEK